MCDTRAKATFPQAKPRTLVPQWILGLVHIKFMGHLQLCIMQATRYWPHRGCPNAGYSHPLALSLTVALHRRYTRICRLLQPLFTIWATNLKLCSTRTLRASRSPWAQRVRYSRSSAAFRGAREGAPSSGQAEGEKKAVEHQVNDWGKHGQTPPAPLYSPPARPYVPFRKNMLYCTRER